MKQAVAAPNICDTPRIPEEEQRAFYDDVMSLAARADARARCGERFIEIAGARIRLLFASESLLRGFMPALSHLEADAATHPEAVIYLWDSEGSGIDMRPAPCRWDCFTDRGDIWGFDSSRFRSAFHWTEISLSLLDVETGVGTFWMRSAEHLFSWAKAAPLRTLFHWLMASRGRQLLHAAAIGTEAGGVLITGRGGVGKSTTALACLEAGMKFVGDDYLVVQLDPEPRAFSLYGAAKLEVPQLQRFPRLQHLLERPDIPEDEKAVLYLSRSDQLAVTASLPLSVAMAPRFVSGSETHIGPSSSAALRHAAAFTTMTQLPHAGRAAYDFIERLMERLPCHELLLGRDIEAIPGVLAEFLAGSRDRIVPERGGEAQGASAERPFVSVVIPVFNGARFLRESVGSIVAQQYSPLEIIVVDDGSTDDLTSAVRELGVDVRLLHQQNLGPAAARNVGIRNAAGELVAFLDVDDLWPPDSLAGLVARMAEHPEVDVVQGYGQLMRSDPADGAPEFIGSARDFFSDCLSTALYRRRAFELVGLLDAELRFGEDTDWFTRARERGVVVDRIEQVTLRIRRHDANMTKDKNLRELGTLRIFKKALDRRRQRQASVDQETAGRR